MVSQSRIELHADVEQRHIGLLEFLHKIFWSLTAVEVVSHHEHESKWKLFTRSREFVCDLIFRLVPCAVVADDSKFQGILHHRQLDVLCIGQGSGKRENK